MSAAEFSAGRKEGDYQDLENRVSDMDRELGVVGRDVKTLFGLHERTTAAIEHLSDSVDRGFHEIRQTSKVPAATWIGGISVLITLLGMAATMIFLVIMLNSSPLQVRQAYQEKAFEVLLSSFKDHQDSHGHPMMMSDHHQLVGRVNEHYTSQKESIEDIKRRLGLIEQRQWESAAGAK